MNSVTFEDFTNEITKQIITYAFITNENGSITSMTKDHYDAIYNNAGSV